MRRATTVAGYLGALGHLVSHAARLIPLEPSARCRPVAVADLRQAFKDLVREEGVVVSETAAAIDAAPAAMQYGMSLMTNGAEPPYGNSANCEVPSERSVIAGLDFARATPSLAM